MNGWTTSLILIFSTLLALTSSAAEYTGGLTIATEGLYLSTVVLDGTSTQLLLQSDIEATGLYVKCSVFEDATCETADKSTLDTYYTAYNGKQGTTPIVYKIRTFSSVNIGGTTLTNVAVFVVYSPLTYLPSEAVGYVGLAHTYSIKWADTTVSFSVALGTTASTSSFRVNEALDAMRKRFPDQDTVAVMTKSLKFFPDVSCVQDRPQSGSTGALACERAKGYALDTSIPTITLTDTALTAFVSKYLSSCAPNQKEISIDDYVCAPSIVATLPDLVFQINNWNFILTPADYTLALESGKVLVLLGNEHSTIHKTLGIPFIRKFPYFTSIDSVEALVFCKLGKTCEKANAESKSEDPVTDTTSSRDSSVSTTTTTPPTLTPTSTDTTSSRDSSASTTTTTPPTLTPTSTKSSSTTDAATKTNALVGVWIATLLAMCMW